MIRVSEGKYRIGDTKVLIFVRVSPIYRKLLIFTVIYVEKKRSIRKSPIVCFVAYMLRLGAKDHRLNGKLMAGEKKSNEREK